MTYEDALEIVVARTKHERYRFLVSEANPDHEAWRAQIVALATGEPIARHEPAPDYPSLATQVGNAIGAAVSFVASGFKVADQAEVDRRLAICRECEQFDAERVRCRACGCCVNFKSLVESQACPLKKW